MIKGAKVMFLCSLGATIFLIHESWHTQQTTEFMFSKINHLKTQLKNKKSLLYDKDIRALRSGLDHYHHIHSQMQLPFIALEKLADVLDQRHLRLQTLVWSNEQSPEIEICFVLQSHRRTSPANNFKELLISLKKAFPQAYVQVIEAPFKSGIHQTYEYPPDHSLPVGHIRIQGL